MSDEVLDSLSKAQEAPVNSDMLEAEDAPTERKEVQPEVEEPTENESEEAQLEAKEPVVEEPKMTEREFNIKEMRKAKERAEREAADAKQKLAEIEAQRPKEEDTPLEAEDFVEGKHFTRIQNRMQKLEAENQRIRDLRDLSALYPDYNSVMTQDAIEKFAEAEPELAVALEAASQGKGWKNAAASTFKLIKKMNNNDSGYSRERAKAAQNAAKPRSLSSISSQQGKSPISRANEFSETFDDAAKEALYLDSLAKAKLIE
jgi:hypothetical protein